ncbi:DNA-directed RNA polymerase subunit omega [Aliicoccus persicus]|uniref:DNA-directed RNA polymerase subunit omega n=1 Tax=Aliicoccus persicus TaxID=930138 RepID=A0A662Z2J1_9STAP|nr:DNA-directed RNA polymerase subunit omega [Aliicoccus persicus]SEV81062.1 DNA-directed RNA polymerase subunit omega [Aliicoccus persicus]HJE19220.1 DNA-directed RNA polymerase subunit omega [Aliicoccus persicus]
MLYPPLHELKKNQNSKYLIVTMAAKRARELQDYPSRTTLENYDSYKEVGKALEEIAAHTVTSTK